MLINCFTDMLSLLFLGELLSPLFGILTSILFFLKVYLSMSLFSGQFIMKLENLIFVDLYFNTILFTISKDGTGKSQFLQIYV